ncbi:carboxymuconolactone decarboxylase family protein [Fusibacter sp. JL216-2]|uniref:carboxymuconolactone decarboxylase family protein n=1 Tax=Fusibacter sp. JL216-2 TaxID=3071453 RepID=UPI003D32EB01
MTNKKMENFIYMKAMHTDVYKAYESFGQAVHEKGGPIDEKNRWLIKVAISASQQYPFALRTHIHKALSAGCTRREVEHAILLVAPTAGFPKAMEGLMILRDELDNDASEEE